MSSYRRMSPWPRAGGASHAHIDGVDRASSRRRIHRNAPGRRQHPVQFRIRSADRAGYRLSDDGAPRRFLLAAFVCRRQSRESRALPARGPEAWRAAAGNPAAGWNSRLQARSCALCGTRRRAGSASRHCWRAAQDTGFPGRAAQVVAGSSAISRQYAHSQIFQRSVSVFRRERVRLSERLPERRACACLS